MPLYVEYGIVQRAIMASPGEMQQKCLIFYHFKALIRPNFTSGMPYVDFENRCGL